MAKTTPYDALIKAASSLTGTEILSSESDPGIEAVAAFVDANQRSLCLARAALSAQCSVPLKFELSFIESHSDVITYFRDLARAFALVMRLAESQRDLGRVVSIGVDMLELANAARRGGITISLLVSAAIGCMAIDHLRRLRTRFDQAQQTELLRHLERLHREREPAQVILARDRRWELEVGCADEPCDFVNGDLSGSAEPDVPEEVQKAVLECLQTIADSPIEERQSLFREQDNRALALLRMLAIDLSLRTHRGANSSYPDDLSCLTPSILSRVPLDPFTDQSFVYRRLAADSFHLYGRGPCNLDHGGVFGSWPAVAAGYADLCLDESDYSHCCSITPSRLGLVSRFGTAMRTAWTRWRNSFAKNREVNVQ